MKPHPRPGLDDPEFGAWLWWSVFPIAFAMTCYMAVTAPDAQSKQKYSALLAGRGVAPEWPYGPPHFHEECCLLFEGASYCDCKASDASDTEYGLAH